MSRVGGSAQIRAMRKVAGRLKLELAQYRDLEAFSQFGSELDAATQRTLARGARFVATLNQPAYAPWPVEEQVAVIYAANQGYLDHVDVPEVPEVNEPIRRELRDKGADLLADIRDTKDLSDETAAKIDAIAKEVVGAPVRRGTRRPRRPTAEPTPSDAEEAEDGGEREPQDDGRRPPRHRLATTRDIKRRIDSVRNTRKITRAMELVASASCGAPRRRSRRCAPTPGDAAADGPGGPPERRRQGPRPARGAGGEGSAVVVAITGDRGLAGAFNVNIVRDGARRGRASSARRASPRSSSRPSARRAPARSPSAAMTIDRSFQGFSIEPTYADAEQVTEHLVRRFTAEEVNRVVIVYNAFKSVLEQTVTTEQLLPVERMVDARRGRRRRGGRARAEPRPGALRARRRRTSSKALLPTFLDTTIYRALLESAAAELAARRTAMHNATDNAGELIDDLTLAMNRARQAAITQEILEVVAGADALQ